MQRYNKTMISFCLVFLLSACHRKNQNLTHSDSMDSAPDIIFGKAPGEVSFEDFLRNANNFYQSQDGKGMADYLRQYASSFQKPEEQQEIALLNAKGDLTLKQYDAAVKQLTTLQKKTTGEFKGRVLFYMAEIAHLQKQYEKAIQLYQGSYQLYRSDEVKSSLADTYVDMNNWKEAIPLYQEILKRQPHSVEDLFRLGACYYAIGQKKMSAKIMQQVLELNPRSIGAYNYLSRISYDQGNKRDSEYYYARSLLLNKNYPSVVNLLTAYKEVYQDAELSSILISALVRSQDFDKAKEAYHKAILISPRFKALPEFQIYNGVLSVIPEQGKEAGKSYFQKLAEEFPDNSLVLSEYANALSSINPQDPALDAIYYKILYLRPEDTSTRYQYALYYQNRHQTEWSQLQYGILYYYQDQKDLSLEVLSGLEQHFPTFKNAQLSLYLGLLHQEQDELDVALSYYQEALEVEPKSQIAQMAVDSIKKLTDNRLHKENF